MKIAIHYANKDGAWGGGNQFLKALRQELQLHGMETGDNPDAVLFNGYQELPALIKHFFLRHRTKRAYRLGPVMSLHRPGPRWKAVDCVMAFAASMCADVVIFQSQWALAQARQFGFWKRRNVFVVPNAVDAAIFHPPAEAMVHAPIRLIYTSWSTNEKKGFSYLQHLDQHLDFTKYSMTFVGNTPISFKNITVLPPQPSEQLADTLRGHDVFVSPTKDDACSNAIIEALSCGLPVAALASGGNGELVRDGGILFKDEEELLQAIDRIASDLSGYRSRVSAPAIGEVTDQYAEAIRASIKIS